MEKLFDLQLFADPESETPTDEVENPSDEEGELELDETEDSTETSSDKEQKQKNFEAAQLRLQRKQAKQQSEEKAKREAYVQGIKKSVGGKNRFTGTAIEDEFDVEEFETMLEMEEKGLNPTEDYNDYVKQKRREARQKEIEAKQQEESKQKGIQEDLDAFVAKHGKEKTQEILNDEAFAKWSEGLLGAIPMTLVYEKYMDFQSKIDNKAQELAIEKDARRTSSSGGLGNSNEPGIKSFKDMSDEEFAEFLNKVR